MGSNNYNSNNNASMKQVSEKSKVGWTKFVGFTKKGNDRAKKQMAKARIHQKKEIFGVAYMDAVEKGASAGELQTIMRAYEAEIQTIREEIRVYDERIAEIEASTKRKLTYTEPEIRMTTTTNATSTTATVGAPTF